MDAGTNVPAVAPIVVPAPPGIGKSGTLASDEMLALIGSGFPLSGLEGIAGGIARNIYDSDV